MNLMKNVAVAAGLSVVSVGAFLGSSVTVASAADSKWSTSSKVDLKSEAAKLGYTFGAQIASDMKRQGLDKDVSTDAMFAAFKDVFAGVEPRLSMEEMQGAQAAYQQKQQAKYQAQLEENKAKGSAFLAKNAKKKGVKTTASGLQYEVLRAGKGKQPTATDSIKVHYLGTLIDGTKFDSSYDRGAPATFGVSGVIPGFSEGLQLMQEGAKYRLTIPSDIAYGEQGPASIGPNQALIFEVELIEVVTQSTSKSAAE
jgi:FKBP-type peptidyl-prolyl cis-trans isomerase